MAGAVYRYLYSATGHEAEVEKTLAADVSLSFTVRTQLFNVGGSPVFLGRGKKNVL